MKIEQLKDKIDGMDLLAIRLSLKMSTAEFAESLGVTPKSVQNWVTGKHHVNQAIIPKIKRLIRRQIKEQAKGRKPMETMPLVEAPSEPEPKPELESPKDLPVSKEPVLPEPVEPPAPAAMVVRKTTAVVVSSRHKDSESLPVYVTPAGLERMRAARTMSRRAFAELIDVVPATYSHWTAGTFQPRQRYWGVLREIWVELFGEDSVEAGDAVNALVPTTTTRVRMQRSSGSAGKTILPKMPAAPLLELSTEYYERYRAERNAREVDAILTFVSEKFQLEKAQLRQMVAVILLTLKKEMSVEAMYEALTGHSS